MTDETYLGDGLYASFDGWQIQLRAPRDNGDHVVYLEPHILKEFNRFLIEHVDKKFLQLADVYLARHQ